MIRVEITRTEWRSEAGIICNVKPVAGNDVQFGVVHQTLLVQEFEALPIEPIVALLNKLQETPPCACGHSKHEGPCRVVVSQGMSMYDTEKRCDCQRYRTMAEADLEREATRQETKADNAMTIAAKTEQKLAHREQTICGLERQVASLTRSRDSLRRRKR